MTDPLLLDLPLAFETPRLRLRVPQPGDGAALCEAVAESRDELRRFLSLLPWVAGELDAAAAEARCREAQAQFITRRDLPFHLYERDGGALVGAVGLHRPVWSVPRLEVGYWCRSGRTGRGYVVEAVQALCVYAFRHARAARLDLVTDVDNAASRRVAERCGFELEGVLRHAQRNPDGALRDLCVYARLAAAG